MQNERRLALIVALLCVGCSTVAIPEENYYRLDLPRLTPMAAASSEILRIEGFELASSLNSDRLLVADNPVQLRAYEFHRWIGPLDRLVQDAVQAGLSRVRAFAEVKGPAEAPGETLYLSGRILDFHQVGEDGAWAGRVTLELRLAASQDRRVLFQEEFSRTVPMQGATPADAARSLSAGTGRIVEDFLERCDVAGVFSSAAQPGK